MKGIFRVILIVLILDLGDTCLAQVPVKYEFTDSAVVSGISKDILFNRASMWIHETFPVQNINIKVQDKAAGVIYGDITITDKKHTEMSATFSLAMNISDGRYFFVFNNYISVAGNLNNTKPDCCLSRKKWRKLQNWATADTRHLEARLKEKMITRSATEDFLTVPLIDTNVAPHITRIETTNNKSRAVTFYIKGGVDYAPGIFSHNGNLNTTGQVTTGEPITMYQLAGGIFVPSRRSPFRGVSIEAGYFNFPLNVKTTYAITGSAPLEQTTTKPAAGLEFYPHYTWLSKNKKHYQLHNSAGIDLMYPASRGVSDLVGLKAESGIGVNGFFITASAGYTINNIYGNHRGQQLTTIKPLFFGLTFSFYPQQNKWVRNIFSK